MKKYNWLLFFVGALILSSILLYVLHYLIFRDVNHIFIYMIGDIAFLPIEVLLVTLIIHRLLNMQERRSKMNKLNMVIGAFFSKVGTRLLTYLSDCDPDLESIRKDLIVSKEWGDPEFTRINELLKAYDYGVDMEKVDLEGVREFLTGNMNFMIRLLENPVLLEHEYFTELLWAVFHLTEELNNREDMKSLPDTDIEHLSGDVKRAYGLLVREWLFYMKHLKDRYPYLFSLAMRMNPFDQEASVIIK
ncbi:MAG: hypothetical protein KKG76_13860 [Euryarchaeota archaeon]|nr:hypothetical protein [Euryarchaeota archaeon]